MDNAVSFVACFTRTGLTNIHVRLNAIPLRFVYSLSHSITFQPSHPFTYPLSPSSTSNTLQPTPTIYHKFPLYHPPHTPPPSLTLHYPRPPSPTLTSSPTIPLPPSPTISHPLPPFHLLTLSTLQPSHTLQPSNPPIPHNPSYPLSYSD